MYTWLPTANSCFPVSGCMDISSSVSQEGERLSIICTVWHKEGEAEGVVVFLCKNRTRDCSPETSLEQLRLKRYRGPDGGSERSSQLVFTIDRATPSNSGIYQCCARSQKSDIHLQGHFFSLSVTGELPISLMAPGGTSAGGQLETSGCLRPWVGSSSGTCAPRDSVLAHRSHRQTLRPAKHVHEGHLMLSLILKTRTEVAIPLFVDTETESQGGEAPCLMPLTDQGRYKQKGLEFRPPHSQFGPLSGMWLFLNRRMDLR